jgi:hypothetical protein
MGMYIAQKVEEDSMPTRVGQLPQGFTDGRLYDHLFDDIWTAYIPLLIFQGTSI